MRVKQLCILFIGVFFVSQVKAQCPVVNTQPAIICSNGQVTDVRFVIKEIAVDCFKNAQTTATSMVFTLNNAAFQFVPGSATLLSAGDIEDNSSPIISNDGNSIIINNLTTKTAGLGKDELDSLIITISIFSTTPGTAKIIKSAGGFLINGVNTAFDVLSLQASEQVLVSTPNPVQTTASVNQSSTNNALMRIPIETKESGCPLQVKKMTFSYSGTLPTDVEKLKVWHSGNSPAFDPLTNKLFGEISLVTGIFSLSGDQSLLAGLNYFWVSVDVPISAIPGNVIDVKLMNYELVDDGVSSTYTNGVAFTGDVPGQLNVTAILSTNINVGACGVPTIQAAFNLIPLILTQNYIIELCPDYNSAAETYPIIFSGRDENGYMILIRPRADVVSQIQINGTPTGTNPTISFSEIDFLTIDGRAGSLGASMLLIANKNNDREVIRFHDGAQNNTVKYVAIQGASNAGVSGLVNFLGSTFTESNSLNTLSYNKFSKISGGKVGVAIYSIGTVGKVNSRNIIDNNEFVDIWDGVNNSSYVIELSNNTSDWTITNNHFYQTNTYAGNNNNSGFLFLGAGGGYTITDNSFGGTAINATGTSMTISSGSAPFDCVYFGPTSGGTKNRFERNLITNIRYTSTAALSGYPSMSLLYNEGGADLDVINNVLGSSFTKDVIRVVNNNSTATVGEGFMAIVNDQPSGVFNIEGNQIGGFRVEGTNPNMDTYLIYNRNEGQISVKGNLFGGSDIDNIDIRVNASFYGVRNLSTIGTVMTGNTFSNINHQSADKSFHLMHSLDGRIVVSNNTVSDITSSTNSTFYLFHHIGLGYTFEKNTIQNIKGTGASGSGEMGCISISNTSDGVVKGNVIGGASASSISSVKVGDLFAVKKIGTGGRLILEGNTIQGFDLKNTVSTTADLIGVHISGGVLEARNNTIKNFVSVTGSTSNSLTGIWVASTSTGHVVANNTISDLSVGASSSNSSNIRGVNITAGSGELSSNYIYSIESEKNNPTLYVKAVDFQSTSGIWNVLNNVIWFKNSNSIGGYQLRAVSLYSTSSVKFYHNTIKLESTVPYYFVTCLDINANGLLDVKNNVFQNLAAGTNANFNAKTVAAQTAYTSPVFSNNYHECPNNTTNAIRWGGIAQIYDVATWNTLTQVTGEFTGTETVNNQGYPAGVVFADKGLDLTTVVPNDKDGVARDATPWVGAYETASTACVVGTATGVWKWTGATNVDWFDCTNWDKGEIPGVNSTVVIPASTIYPTIKGQVADCFEIQIDVTGGASVTVDVSNLGGLKIHKP